MRPVRPERLEELLLEQLLPRCVVHSELAACLEHVQQELLEQSEPKSELTILQELSRNQEPNPC